MYQHFGETCCLQLHGEEPSSILKMEAAGSFETLLSTYQTTQCHASEVCTIFKWLNLVKNARMIYGTETSSHFLESHSLKTITKYLSSNLLNRTCNSDPLIRLFVPILLSSSVSFLFYLSFIISIYNSLFLTAYVHLLLTYSLTSLSFCLFFIFIVLYKWYLDRLRGTRM
jgi:hypothetical protein